jgi:hypothetical protein
MIIARPTSSEIGDAATAFAFAGFAVFAFAGFAVFAFAGFAALAFAGFAFAGFAALAAMAFGFPFGAFFAGFALLLVTFFFAFAIGATIDDLVERHLR